MRMTMMRMNMTMTMKRTMKMGPVDFVLILRCRSCF